MSVSTRFTILLGAWVGCCSTVNFAAGQTVILSDDFESGTVGNALTTIANGGVWGRVGGGADTPKYASASNPFAPGAQYADLFAPLDASTTSLLSSDPADTGLKGPSIAGHVTTWSFNFYEPGDFTGTGDGFLLGYTNSDDLNSAERVWRANMINGTLAPLAANEGAAVTYPVNTVNTLFMIANDSANTLIDYQPGQTLEPGDADVWLSVNGAAPEFAFALTKQNPTTNPQGVGFRSLSGMSERLWIDNLLLVDGATFARDNFEPPPRLSLLVDRTSGQVRIENNTDESMAISSYRIISNGDASLNQAGWNAIAEQGIPGFPVGNGTGNGWEIGPNSDNGELREYFLLGESTLDPEGFVSLGAAYNTAVDAADLRFEYLLGDTLVSAPVMYGTISVGAVAGDYSGNGVVDAEDYTIWRDHLGQNFQLTNEGPGQTPGTVTSEDYSFWKAHFGETGSGGAATAQQAVPEPATAWLMLAVLSTLLRQLRRTAKRP
jgi:hypothetical protein